MRDAPQIKNLTRINFLASLEYFFTLQFVFGAEAFTTFNAFKSGHTWHYLVTSGNTFTESDSSAPFIGTATTLLKDRSWGSASRVPMSSRRRRTTKAPETNDNGIGSWLLCSLWFYTVAAGDWLKGCVNSLSRKSHSFKVSFIELTCEVSCSTGCCIAAPFESDAVDFFRFLLFSDELVVNAGDPFRRRCYAEWQIDFGTSIIFIQICKIICGLGCVTRVLVRAWFMQPSPGISCISVQPYSQRMS